ncbi:MAG: carbonic anhydrase [Sphaerochaetaceae bacterium]|nr:carbonic anhydrase [Sphaerochaetaceae bacterium]MDC7247503.1 carbonic anhydrase [Sphaerochaetaceae bacterium]
MRAIEALERLKDGHSRFLKGTRESTNKTLSYAKQLHNKQEPFAVIVSCSDSRVSPELIFDAGFGDLFTIRTAGNIISDYDLASIEYAVLFLDVRLILVVGHSDCGAVRAAAEDTPCDSMYLTGLKDAITAVIEVEMSLDDIAQAHIEKEASSLTARSKILSQTGQLRIATCFYRLDNGKICW